MPGPRTFAARAFRAAVGEAGVDVLRIEIEACGRVERAGAAIWLVAGPNRFTLAQTPAFADAGEQCLSAALDDGQSPGRLGQVRPMSGGGR